MWDSMKLLAILLLLLLLGCQTRPLSPNAKLAELTAELKTQCVQLCATERGEASVQAEVPAGTQIYTTDEAICALHGNALFCARCPCELIQADVLNATAEENATCTLQKGAQLLVECT